MKISAVKGFRDVLPEESARWSWIERTARTLFARYHYDEIRLPVAEKAALFGRSIGEFSDIVEKEMYTFEDRDGTRLALRPEGTASVVRAYVEHSIYVKNPEAKFYYIGPMFRRERPQKGRYRQFHQIGVEAFGREDPVLDAEVILLVADLLDELAVERAWFELNSLGCSACRPRFREAVRKFGERLGERLCENCRRRLGGNPLRILDCKEEACRAATENAPSLPEFWCEACREHFSRVRELVSAEGIAFRENPRLVRGLDYYCRTAFEVLAAGLGAQNAIGGGGRYDGLVEALGGPDVPAVGVALGIERLAMVAGPHPEPGGVEVFVAPVGRPAEKAAQGLAHRLRRAGVRVEMESGDRSLRSQMRRAHREGARFTLIVGEEELADGAATVRDMVAKRDFRRSVPLGGDAETVLTALRRLGGGESAKTGGS
ncbi:MAG: histidine--tRNA ligase [Candidatus Binatia bacterium]|nr:MAG: histidine--tRNA ligase [Candidatus Binatia bacterium]